MSEKVDEPLVVTDADRSAAWSLAAAFDVPNYSIDGIARRFASHRIAEQKRCAEIARNFHVIPRDYDASIAAAITRAKESDNGR